MDGKVTADLVESNGILPSGLWLNHLHGRPATTTAVVLKARGLRRHWQRVIKTRYINVVKLRISHQWRSISNSGKNQSSQKVSRSSWQWSRSSKNFDCYIPTVTHTWLFNNPSQQSLGSWRKAHSAHKKNESSCATLQWKISLQVWESLDQECPTYGLPGVSIRPPVRSP